MRILFVTSEYINPNTLKVIDGGLANYLYKITIALKNLGHDIDVIVKDDIEKHFNFKGINVHFLNTNSGFKKTFFKKIIWCFLKGIQRREIKLNYFCTKTLPDFIKEENKKAKIDIVQYASCLGLGRSPLKDIPCCLRISSWAKVSQKYYDSINENEITFETQQIKNQKFIFGPSKHIADIIKKDLNEKKEIKIIESPYDNEDIEFDTSILDEIKYKTSNNPYLLFFGTIKRLKGAKEIALCIKDIFEKYPNLYLVLIGKTIDLPSEPNYVDFIKQKAEKHLNRILHFNSVPHEKLYPVIENSYGVLMPSLIENFSNACVEAMRLKKIVIGTEGNFSQLIDDKVSGFLAKAGDSNSLKEKIIELMELSKDDKGGVELASYQRTENLSPQKIAQKLLEYYNYVIENWENE